jgi:hypothetical protein
MERGDNTSKGFMGEGASWDSHEKETLSSIYASVRISDGTTGPYPVTLR